MRKLSDYGPSIVVLVTAALVLLLGPTLVRELTYRKTRAQVVQARELLEETTVLEELNEAYRAIAEMVEPSVVHISAQQRFPNGRSAISTGSGWIYDELGHVVTNHHVVADAERIDVQLHSGVIRDAEVVGSDPATDIAVLRIDPEHVYPAVLGDPLVPVQQGDMVFAFGSPFDFRFSMSSGVVSGQGRHVGVIRDQIGNAGYENFIQVDAAINPGNSGGPLTDHRGRVIGMNTAIATGGNRGSLDSGQFAGIGLAIPLDMIQPAVTQIIEKGFVAKGFLGVVVDELTALTRARLGYEGEGALIRTVEADTPAFDAGIQANDIVRAINGRPIATRAQLQSTVSSILPGDTIEVAVWRWDRDLGAGAELELAVTLGRLPTLRTRGVLPEDHPEDHIRALGIARMVTATPEAAATHGVPSRQGVIIEALVPGTALARQVEPGSIITAINDLPITSTRDLLDVLSAYDLRAYVIGYPPREVGGVKATIQPPSGRDRLVDLRYRTQR